MDPGLYSKQLMSHAKEAANSSSVFTESSPAQILQAAYEKTLVQGSSTACVLTLGSQGRIFGANLGDSGEMTRRKSQPVAACPGMARGCAPCPPKQEIRR